MITILTPTYNRGKLLERLYKSLFNQRNFNFEWLIIDDGSTDDTQNIVKNFESAKFNIIYKYKNNGGKHTALNYSQSYINGDWIFVVDSDDVLTNDAIEIIYKYVEKYKNRNDIACLSFNRGDKNGVPISKRIFKNDYISNYIDYRINLEAKGDQAEIYKTEIFKMFRFPVFNEEKFLGEDYFHINVGYLYNTVYINKIIYICEYLDGGLTKSGRRMRIQNPLGGMLHGSLYFSKRFKTKYRIKGMMLYICYGMFAGKKLKDMYNNCGYKMLFIISLPASILLYFFWKYRYQ